MADEAEPARGRRPTPCPRQPPRPPEPMPRTQVPQDPCTTVALMPPPTRLIRPSEHLAMIERDAEIRQVRHVEAQRRLILGDRFERGHESRRSDRSVDRSGRHNSLALVERRPEQMALVERQERRPPHLTPNVTVVQGPKPAQPPPVQQKPHQHPARVSAPPPPVLRLQQNQQNNQAAQALPVQPVALPPPSAAPAPPSSLTAAPRTIVIHRPDAKHGFGFTLRHLVVYPPESLQELYEDARHLAVGAVGAPMDTIFVRSVRPGGPAAVAGLRAGDRVLAVNGEPVACGRSRAPYARVVQLAQKEPRTLKLTVVPKDHDLLQRYFSEAAYNPESNQRQLDMPAPVTEHESRLFDAYRKPRASMPAPQAPPRHRDDAEYASVASLASSRYDVPRFGPTHHIIHHDRRRESDGSLPSSVTESKDSLGSFDSNSTLTGRELDDSIIFSRIRKSLEQKEEFLRRPSQPTGWLTPELSLIKPKEFYARPQKLQKPAWPPPATSPPPITSPPPSHMQQQQSPEQKRNEDCSASVDSGTYSAYGEMNGTHRDHRIKPDKGHFVATLTRIQETAPSIVNANSGPASNGSSGSERRDDNSNKDKYPVPELQLVTARTRQLEEARGGGERRTEVARSELARMSTPRLEPTVALRRREYETKTNRREARSLDVQQQQVSELENDPTSPGGINLSGNQMMITGSKHLHCPPPDGFTPDTEKVQMRARSNSTGSEGLPMRRHHVQDGSHAKKRMGLTKEQMEALTSLNGCEEMRAQRPTHLSLAPASPTLSSVSPSPTPSTPADSGFADESLVTRRQKKDHLGEEERAMRRVSYLKATWGDRLHLESDTEPDTEHLALRSPDQKGDESIAESIVEAADGDVEGHVQIKMVVSNGKRASDRSWKQVWAALHGTKLYLYRHHPTQSPGNVPTNTAAADPASRDALDVRYSLAALADDYTKRKHVVRVTTASGAELLLQADGAADAQRWLAALRRHSAEPPPADATQLTTTPLSTPANSAPECPSPLPPQRNKKIGRNRSPTGPPTPTLPSSPKNKTWKGRMAKQLRRMHGGNTPSTPAPATGWLGAPIERCPTDAANPLVPRAVTLPASAVEAYGLRTVGVYRVPGNAAGVAAMAAAMDRGEPPPEGDPRWTDVHVASSLLKAYLRRLPDPLLTAELYPAFIAADRSPERARELRRLVQALPAAHYETLKYLIEHLRRVVAHASYNKMESRNLAIVFGPTLVRAASDDMLAMVNDMSSQCRIIESLLNHYDWYFEEEETGRDPPHDPPPAAEELSSAPQPSRDLLIHNVKKMEGKDVSTRDIVSSIISAANRKIQRKPRTKTSSESKKWAEPDKLSPPRSPLSSPPAHLTTSLADYDGLPHTGYGRQHEKLEVESMVSLGSRQELSRHTHALTSFSIEETGDLVTSLTSTFDQKLRTLNNSSPLDDGSIPYADEGDAPDEPDEGHEDKSSASASSAGSERDERERLSVGVRAHTLKAAWLARDHRHSSCSSGDEPPAVTWPRAPPSPPSLTSSHSTPQRPPAPSSDETDADSEKENCISPKKTTDADSDKDVDTRSQTSSGGTLPDNDKSIERVLYPSTYDNTRPPPAETPPAPSPSPDNIAPRRAHSRPGAGTRVLRSESLNCRVESRLLRSDSLGKGERLTKGEKGEWNVVRRREGALRSTKLKRKNGMPERGIKRRHTVGGTKDFDKDGWSGRHTRTSSPELSGGVWPAPLVPPPRPPLESHV